VFRGILRKTGEPYARHPVRIALMLMLYLDIWDADVIATALLHDVTEKERRRWNIRRIVREFGRLVALYVRGMTRPKEISGKRNKLQVDTLYHEQLARADVVVLILKGLDRWDNIATMWLHSDQELHDKNRETDEFIFPLLEKHQDHPAVSKLLAGLHATMELAAAKRLPRAA
jgi:(p)ppGpp synthase/HD superfamily hydrolase